MAMRPTSCGELLTSLLRDFGVELIFGIPGVHTVELYRGLPASGIRHVTPRHEQGAGFMADGYARASGKVGVCFVITGPGLTNILTAMGQAYGDSIPMLVISSVNRREHLGLAEGRLHELKSQQGIASGVAAFSHTVMAPEQLPSILHRAFSLFAAERPRPVHIELPLDVLLSPMANFKPRKVVLPTRAAPSPHAIHEAADALSKAKSPFVVLGGGSVDASREAIDLLDWLDAPVVTTVNAMGVIPPDHLKLVGSNLADASICEALRIADVVLAVGTEFGETEMYPEPVELEFSGRLIRIDIDPAQTTRTHAPYLAIHSDARSALTALTSALRAIFGERSTEGRGAATADRIRAEKGRHWPVEYLTYQLLTSRIASLLPDAIWVGDSTQPVFAANQFFVTNRPRSFFNSTTGYGTVGYALPAAIGAKLAAPHRPVICMIGDGGLQFTLPEMATAVEVGVSIVVLLWSNGGYGEIKKSMLAGGVLPQGVDLHRPDFIKIAQGFGWEGRRVKALEDLDALLRAAAISPLPTLLEIDEESALGW
jgi:acetolactate synthase I/II/III large subunit